MIKLHQADSRNVLRRMIAKGEFVDSVVCDPPYGLVSVIKRFGKDGAAPAQHGKDGLFARQSRGFMGKQWDGTAIERDPDFWRLVYDVMKPGAYIVAFSSSRTYHHMAVAMEIAGFITHPMIGWTFASGFPKAHDAARAIDRELGVEGHVVPSGEPVKRMIPGADQHRTGSWEKNNGRVYQPGDYVPATDEAAQWDGWAYGGQARKPALEPIYVGQKPFSERNGALNILKHGVGAVNIDDCRVPMSDDDREFILKTARPNTAGQPAGNNVYGAMTPTVNVHKNGRWPANLIHDGSPEVVALFPDSAGQLADASTRSDRQANQNVYGEMRSSGTGKSRGDEGSAARFFESYPFEDRPIFHYAKAGKRDRAGSKHPTVKPIALMRALIRHVTPPGGTVLDPFAGSGTTGAAAIEEGVKAILIEREREYADDIRRRFNMPITIRPGEDIL